MKFNNCPLRTELKEGLIQYERDTNISPHSLVESLIEDFLYKNDYLTVAFDDEDVPPLSELVKPRLKHVSIRENGNYQIRKDIGGVIYSFGNSKDYEQIKNIIQFLIRKNWDTKYSTKETRLRGQKHVKWILSEMEKEKKLMGTE